MKVIVPVDFTQASFTTASFAVKMLSNTPDASVVLYHVYETDDEAKLVKESLAWLKESTHVNSNVQIETVAEKGDFVIPCLARLARKEAADLIVMAVNKMQKVILGNYSLQMIEQNICPVLVIPPTLQYHVVKNIAIACDSSDCAQSIPLVQTKKLLDIFQPNLYIVNVNSGVYFSENNGYNAQQKLLGEMFLNYRPQFHYISTYNFHERLHQFVADKKIDMVLIFPHKDGFINNSIRGNNTRTIVFDTNVPVLAAID